MRQIAKMIMANQKLEELYLDQIFYGDDVMELRKQLKRENIDIKKLFIFCRGYGPDVTGGTNLHIIKLIPIPIIFKIH